MKLKSRDHDLITCKFNHVLFNTGTNCHKTLYKICQSNHSRDNLTTLQNMGTKGFA